MGIYYMRYTGTGNGNCSLGTKGLNMKKERQGKTKKEGGTGTVILHEGTGTEGQD